MTLLATDDGRRFLVPPTVPLDPGELTVNVFPDGQRTVQEAQVAPYACTEDDAMSFMWSAGSDELNRTLNPALKAFGKVLTGQRVSLWDLKEDRRMSRIRMLEGLARLQADPSAFDEAFAEAAGEEQDPLIREMLEKSPGALKHALGHGPPPQDGEE